MTKNELRHSATRYATNYRRRNEHRSVAVEVGISALITVGTVAFFIILALKLIGD